MCFVGSIQLENKGYFDKVDNIREPISMKTNDWNYLAIEGNEMSVEKIVVYSPGHTFGIDHNNAYLLCKLILKNQNNIYKNPKENSIKIYLRFNELYVINSLYDIDKYNGKESTLYVDRSLLNELKKIHYTNIEHRIK